MKKVSYEILKEHKIKDVMNDVMNGKYVIPTYQREYVWKPSKIVDLLKSIIKGYPIGIITDTLTSNKSLLSRERNEVLSAISSSVNKFTNVLVDGQQRITSLSIVYFSDSLSEKMNEIKNDKVKKAIKDTLNKIAYFEGEIYEIKELKSLFEERNLDIDIEEEAYKWLIRNENVAEEFRKEIDNYELPILRINANNDFEIIEVFSAMNKGGAPLDHIDLMHASIFNIKNEFDLSKFIKDTNGETKDFGKIDKNLFTQLMKIFYDISNNAEKVDFSKKALLEDFSMNEKKVNWFWVSRYKFQEVLKEAIGLLKEELGIFTIKLMPKNVYLLTTFAFVILRKQYNISMSVFHRIIKLISFNLLEGIYASSPGAKVTDDINNYLCKWAINNNKEEPYKYSEMKADLLERIKKQINNLVYKNKTNAFYKMFISIISRNNPRYILENKTVAILDSTGITVENDLHHFIPKKSSHSETFNLVNPNADFNVDSIKNITIITKDENRKEIRNADINIYLNQSLEILGPQKFSMMLQSHYFDEDIIEKIMKIPEDVSSQELKDLLEELFDERLNMIAEEIMLVYFGERNE